VSQFFSVFDENKMGGAEHDRLVAARQPSGCLPPPNEDAAEHRWTVTHRLFFSGALSAPDFPSTLYKRKRGWKQTFGQKQKAD